SAISCAARSEAPATYYAIAGASERAAQLMAEADQIWEREAPSVAENVRKLFEADIEMAKGTVAYFAGRHEEANAAIEKTLKTRQETGVALDDLAIYRYHGLVLEQLGELDRASAAFQKSIQLSEALRQSYTVAERTAFFRSVVQKSYHGLIRVSARYAARDGGIERFWEAVQASEMVRARQLGDLIDPNAPAVISRG